MKLIIYIIKLLLCSIFIGGTFYVVTLLPDKDLLVSLVIWFFINMIVAAYACEICERMVNYIRQRRNKHAKNTKDN